MLSFEGFLESLVSRYLKEYIKDYDPKQLKIGLWNGELVLNDAEIRKEALDALKLPVDVVRGRIGKLRATWASLREIGSKPVKLEIEDIFLLIKASQAAEEDPDDHFRRLHKVKMDKVAKAEMLNTGNVTGSTSDHKNESMVIAFRNKVIDNLQVNVKNVHLRYEDDLSVPDHPFAIGITLAELSAVSTDEKWREAFVVGSPLGVHKLAKLDSMAVYFDTDAPSFTMASLEHFVESFRSMTARAGHVPDHQYIMRPVTGQGKVIVRKKLSAEEPRYDVSLDFRELGFLIDADQYRDSISLVDLFHFKSRRTEYMRFQPTVEELAENKARARWRFAIKAIIANVHDRAYKWSWDFFKQRRDDRLAYVQMWKKRLDGQLPVTEAAELETMEKRLHYRDIVFFRSVARNNWKKERAEKKKEMSLAPKAASSGGWLSWVWGGDHSADEADDLAINEEDRKKLYSAIEWDENVDIAAAVDMPRDALKFGIQARLDTGSFTLRSKSTASKTGKDLVRVMFDKFSADVLQRPENFSIALSLGGFRVFDGTVENSQHPQIVRVKEGKSGQQSRSNTLDVAKSQKLHLDVEQIIVDPNNPFFYVKYEFKPLDHHAEYVLDLKMRPSEIVYHRGFIEEVVAFFKPPESQLESITALLDAATVAVDGIRQETRAGLEWAFNKHKRVDVNVNMNAPIFILPEDVTSLECQHIVLDAGRIVIKSDLVDDSARKTINSKVSKQYTEEDYKFLETVLYDRFVVDLSETQFLVGTSLGNCYRALAAEIPVPEVQMIEKISMHFEVALCIVNTCRYSKVKITGELPDLHVHFSDLKYATIMKMIDTAIPEFDDSSDPKYPGIEPPGTSAPPIRSADSFRRFSEFTRPGFFGGLVDDGDTIQLSSDDDESGNDIGVEKAADGEGDDEFFEAPDVGDKEMALVKKQSFYMNFSAGSLVADLYKSSARPDMHDQQLAQLVLEGFSFELVMRTYDYEVSVGLMSMYVEDRLVEENSPFKKLVTSEALDDTCRTTELARFSYHVVDLDSPEFLSRHEGISKTVEAELSTLNVIFTRPTILTIYKWTMDTFFPEEPVTPPTPPTQATSATLPIAEPEPGKFRFMIRLTSIAFILNEDGAKLATLSLSAADVAVLLCDPNMRVTGRLSSLTLSDETTDSGNKHFRKLLQIQGNDLADFQYETFSRDEVKYPGHDAKFYLRSGSVEFTIVDDILHRILVFFAKFGQMKTIMDKASEAALQQATDLANDASRFHYDIMIRTPIIVFARDKVSPDAIIAHLGEISAFNSFSGDDDQLLTTIKAGLHNIRLTSHFGGESERYELQLLKQVNMDVVATTFANIDRSQERQGPDMDIVAHMSDVKGHLTQEQYNLIFDLIFSTLAIYDLSDVKAEEQVPEVLQAVPELSGDSTTGPILITDFPPELNGAIARTESGTEVQLYSTMEFVLDCDNITVEFYDSTTKGEDSLKAASITRLTAAGNKLKYRNVSDGSMVIEVVLKTVKALDTRDTPKNYFREIMPGTKHDGNQFMINYSSMPDGHTMLHIELDSPQIIASIDYEQAVSGFIFGGPPQEPATPPPPPQGPPMVYRINIVKPRLALLADPARQDSDAVHLTLAQLCLTQQTTMTCVISRLGMSLGSMGGSNNSGVRFLDDVDITASWDTQQDAGQARTMIELRTQPLVVRASPQDLQLIYSIYLKASAPSTTGASDEENPTNESGQAPPTQAPASLEPNDQQQDGATLEITSEFAVANIDALQLVIISDAHQLPLLDFRTREFAVTAKDWSSSMAIETEIESYINYFNFGNSHWEPLMDPWWFRYEMSTTTPRSDSPPRQEMKLFSKKRLELNVTASFIESALVSYSLMNKESSQSAASRHGPREPYIIRNRTGYGLRIWAQYEIGKGGEHHLDDGCDTPWRFEDWRVMRENVMSSSHDRLGLALKGTQWDPLGSISVIREGDHVYALRPKTRSITHRLLCHVEIHDNIKVVTFRSTFQVQNDTAMPLEMIVVDEAGNRVRDIYQIAPGTACPVPIESAYDHLIKIRPNQGFGYTWCRDAFHWKDLVKQPVRTIVCPDEREGEPATRLVAATLYDKDDRVVRYYPKITLRLRAPVEVENLLPYDIKYRVYLKEQEHTYSAFLRKGGRSPIHIVDPLDLLLLGIDVLDDDAPNFKSSDYSIVNTDNPEDLPIENRLRIQDDNQLDLNLRLHYFRYPMSGGAFKIQIYCPYVIFNKTGLDFGIKSKPFIGSTRSVAGQGAYRDTERRKEPKPFLFAHASDDRRNRAVIRIGDSGWSKPVSLEAVGADQQLSVHSSTKDCQMLVGLGIAEGLGEYKLTKVVTLYPRFLVKNMSTCSLWLRERGSQDEIKVTPQTRVSLGWLRNIKDPQLVFAFDVPLNKEWSTAVQIQNVGKTYVRMPDKGRPERLLLVEILLQGPSIFIHLHADPGEWPIIVRNESSVGICFGQTKKHEGGSAHDVVKLYQCASGSSVDYTWDEPTVNAARLRIGFADSQSGAHYRDVGVFEIGTLKPLTRRKAGHEVKLAFDVLAEGHTQIVCITNYAEDQNIWKQTTRKSGPGERPARSDTYMSATEFEAASTESPDTFTLSISLEGIGISLVDKRLRELAYVSFRGIDATLLDSAAQSSYGLIIRWIQIDNQLDEAPYQTWLRPADLPANPKELDTRPNLSSSLIRVKDNKHGVIYIKYASVLLQKMAIEADESSLYAVAAFSKVFTPASDDADKSCLTLEPIEIPEPAAVEGGADLYFEVLHLQPLVFVISFERQDGIDVSERTFDSRNPLFFAVNAVTMAIGSISDATLMLNEMRIDDARMSANVLTDRLFQHYKSELLSKVFRILGSVDILGNPVGLFNNISSGVTDLFYEPYHGLVVHGGSDLGVSVARGAGRFVKGTATGIGESLSKISGSFGKGLSVVAMDEEWARERQRRQLRNRNKINGFSVGASAFMNGIASGVSGVALKPIEGASRDGVQGAAKGIGKGMVGLVAKPTVGLLDFFAGATGTLRNAATIFDAAEQGRARLPRHIAHDGILRPYSAREAQGLEWLKTIDNGRFRNSRYVAHVELPNDEDHVCILTTKELLLARMNKLSRTWHVQLSDLKAISLEASGISMTLRDSNKAGPFIALSENSTKVWFFQQVKNVVNDYNEARSRAGGGR